ncbi:transcription initiation factor TFIID subunit 8 [Drosophila serrata]|uniref:transcription initiation factor TFIID subunit 8 n=1 Tax=Drosophila serrata TaxID=7274 RepID=UPI000A1CFBAE|nr:transcription initiation factor TFIID subunit 8 [Drosophila serrata]
MNAYDRVLYKVVWKLLMTIDCRVKNRFILDLLVEELRIIIRFIATRTTNASNHAGRTVPTLFDLERTFRQLGFVAYHVRDTQCRSYSYRLGGPVKCPDPQTRDEDFHRGPEPMLTETSIRELPVSSHIPDHFPPFPGAHSFKGTSIKKSRKKTYSAVRKGHALNQHWTQSALNKFYLGSEPYLSLNGNHKAAESIFKVLVLDPREKMACLDALMPRNEILKIDVYEDKDEKNPLASQCPFLMEPKMESTHQYDGMEDIIMHVEPNVMEMDSSSDDDEINWSMPD